MVRLKRYYDTDEAGVAELWRDATWSTELLDADLEESESRFLKLAAEHKWPARKTHAYEYLTSSLAWRVTFGVYTYGCAASRAAADHGFRRGVCRRSRGKC